MELDPKTAESLLLDVVFSRDTLHITKDISDCGGRDCVFVSGEITVELNLCFMCVCGRHVFSPNLFYCIFFHGIKGLIENIQTSPVGCKCLSRRP